MECCSVCGEPLETEGEIIQGMHDDCMASIISNPDIEPSEEDFL